MDNFATLINQLEETSNLELQQKALVEYLEQADEDDKIWAIALLFDKRPKRIIKQEQLKEWGQEISQLPTWLFETSLEYVGDLMETVSLTLPAPQQATAEPLHFWIKHLDNLATGSEEDKKAGLLEAWDMLEPPERFIFNKLATGSFRVKVDQQKLASAIAKVSNKSPFQIAHRLLDKWQPRTSSFEKLFLSKHPNDELARPYPFYSTFALAANIETVGDPAEWLAERKWDGLRIQIIIRQDQLFIWTTKGFLITPKCPELFILKDQWPNGTVLDGELLAVKNKQPLPLAKLQARLSKKNVSKKTLEEVPLFFMAYDLLEIDHKDIRSLSFVERRKKLEGLFEAHTVPSELLQISPMIEFTDWTELIPEKDQARKHFAVGLVLKHKDSIYQEGRIKGAWWKWKAKDLSIKAVLLYAQSRGWGGGEANYTFAVWEGENLIPVTKTMAGISDEEIIAIQAFVRKNTVEKFGPVRSVKPELLFEISFEAIQPSSRHKCGFVLRNPTIISWLKGSPVDEADSLTTVKSLLPVYGDA